MEEQAATFIRQTKAEKLGTGILMHDRDGKFMATFDAAIKQSGIDVKKSAPRSPNTVAFVERFIQTIQQECLDHFIVFGSKHMDYLCSQFAEYYHNERPHQGKENDLLTRTAKAKRRSVAVISKIESLPLSQIRCNQRHGGLLKHYYRSAA
jgi:putative transposase